MAETVKHLGKKMKKKGKVLFVAICPSKYFNKYFVSLFTSMFKVNLSIYLKVQFNPH